MTGMQETVRVRLSSEDAGAISLTQVVVRDIPIRELVEYMLGFTGKDEARVRELLMRGSLVSGASRFRWQGWDPGPERVREVLATFPNAEPERLFAPERCVRVVLRGGRAVVEVPRESGSRKNLFQRASFWDVLMTVAGAGAARYVNYSYRDRADWYQLALTAPALRTIRDAARLVAFSTLRNQIAQAAFGSADLFVTREGGG